MTLSLGRGAKVLFWYIFSYAKGEKLGPGGHATEPPPWIRYCVTDGCKWGSSLYVGMFTNYEQDSSNQCFIHVPCTTRSAVQLHVHWMLSKFWVFSKTALLNISMCITMETIWQWRGTLEWPSVHGSPTGPHVTQVRKNEVTFIQTFNPGGYKCIYEWPCPSYVWTAEITFKFSNPGGVHTHIQRNFPLIVTNLHSFQLSILGGGVYKYAHRKWTQKSYSNRARLYKILFVHKRHLSCGHTVNLIFKELWKSTYLMVNFTHTNANM